jgi:hypothetical protein
MLRRSRFPVAETKILYIENISDHRFEIEWYIMALQKMKILGVRC